MAAASKSLTLFGAGRMGGALLDGWLGGNSKLIPSIIDPQPSPQIEALAAAGKIRLNPEPAPADTLVIAVKPQVFHELAETIAAHVGPKTLVLSVMAGIRISKLADLLGTKRVVRAMPNTPGSIGRGVTVLFPAAGATKADLESARKLLMPLGDVEGPLDEKYVSAVSGLSGSGPAYVFLLAEVMALAGEAEGLPKELAERLARRTVEGSAALLEASTDSPQDLRRAVTSPGGLTQAALDILMDEGGMPGLMRNALRAAINRDKALSRDPD